MPTYVDRTCESCGREFKITLSRANIPGKGRFCSRDCANTGQRHETLTSRYRYVMVQSHPLLPDGGQLPEHRVVLYAKLGPGLQACHWCEAELSWEIQAPARGSIVTDHLDDDTHNNSPGNLVPSCHRCNTIRTHDRRFAEKPFVISATDGTRRTAVERICQRKSCGRTFLFELALLKTGPNRGKYCSLECLHKRSK